jgi:hypothetical protein
MTYRATVRNGAVEMEDGVYLPEGAILRVEVEALAPLAPIQGDDELSAQELEAFKARLMEFCGIVEGPGDMSERHDFYAHGKIEE